MRRARCWSCTAATSTPALDFFDSDPSFRFNVDGAMVAREFTRTRSHHQVQRMRDAVAAGRLGVNAFHSNMLSGAVGLDEIIHPTDLALEELPISGASGLRYANLTDVPVYSRTIPSVLCELGIDGFVGMANHGHAATDSSDVAHLLSKNRSLMVSLPSAPRKEISCTGCATRSCATTGDRRRRSRH